MNDIKYFINSLILASTEGREPMTVESAAQSLQEWNAEGWEDIPEDLDAETLAALWNDGIKDKPLHRFTFCWKRGSAADNMIALFKAAGIPWRYGSCFNLQAVLNGSGFVDVEYYHIAGKIFGITEKPVTAQKYFRCTSEELWQEKPDADGYFREELKTLDRTEEPGRILAGSLLAALEMADEYRRAGYESVDIVASCQHYGRYYVLCSGYNPALRAC